MANVRGVELVPCHTVAGQQKGDRTNMAENSKSAEATVLNTKVLKKLKGAFQAFDTKSDNTVDIKEIGTIFYSLGFFPTQADLQKFTSEVEDERSGYIHWDRFLPAMTKVLLEDKFPPISDELLLQAFEVLDKEKRGYLEPEELTNYMTKEGEPFTQEEMDEMLTAFTDEEKKHIYYKDVIPHLTLERKM
ncbi:dynein regulatory complex protein 8 isoform X1 [Pundamilia nyererei]|uniref:Dynein regulatory complex protein 8 isoform X1 n=1 Tax=Pundamilia nyererei TaxID=303518 RepID=A0A9Y3R1X1_9CICH|nr:PREDICTED: EF-hand calcium-binding domain-containing protein 2 isoform X1 [Pundamilia nyererei]